MAPPSSWPRTPAQKHRKSQFIIPDCSFSQIKMQFLQGLVPLTKRVSTLKMNSAKILSES